MKLAPLSLLLLLCVSIGCNRTKKDDAPAAVQSTVASTGAKAPPADPPASDADVAAYYSPHGASDFVSADRDAPKAPLRARKSDPFYQLSNPQVSNDACGGRNRIVIRYDYRRLQALHTGVFAHQQVVLVGEVPGK